MLEPLSSLLRPESLDEFIGQEHLVGEGMPIRRFIDASKIPSMVFWGPPGTGKTTLAYIISKEVRGDFYHLSGVTSKKEDLTKIISKARTNFSERKATIVFLDEIHRWNKAQQDTLLPYVEKGILTLIGATTENPSFTINNALLSRCRVFVFEKIVKKDIVSYLKAKKDVILGYFPGIDIKEEILEKIGDLANGDLRNGLNILETAILLKGEGVIEDADILKGLESRMYYDRDTDEHYNIISAVHKSLRDSDPDAACYWIGRMLYAGEDPLYIARRLIRFASEDIGMKDTFAFVLANNTYEAIQKIGMPECDIFLFELAIYLARAPKSNLVYRVSQMVKDDFKRYGNLGVPLHLRNADTKLLKGLGYGAGYKYAHDFKDAKVEQVHFPEEMKGRKYIEDGEI